MKKSFLTLGLLSSLAFAANAQDAATSSSEFKPTAGNVTVELTAQSPFASGSPFNLDRGGLRFRYFLNDNLAVRVGFLIGSSSQKQDFGGKDETSSVAGTTTTGNNATLNNVVVKSSSFTVSILPGLEVHKNISERLSVYYGGYIDFTTQSAKASIEASAGSNSPVGGTSSSNFDGSYKYEVKGDNFGNINNLANPIGNTGNVTVPGLANNRAFTRIGLTGVVGADYYITKGLYLGVEAGWGFSSTSYKKVTQKTTDTIVPTGTTTASDTRTVEANKDSAFNLGTSVTTAFRFGFWF